MKLSKEEHRQRADEISEIVCDTLGLSEELNYGSRKPVQEILYVKDKKIVMSDYAGTDLYARIN